MFYSSTNNYDNLTDEELIDIIHTGDKQCFNYLLNKYKELINIKVTKYFIIGAEREDIIQEGMIGLFKAVKNYKPNKQNSFKSFASLCIERQLITAIKTSNRQKHIPLNSYLSLNMSAYDEDNNITLLDTFKTNYVEDPLDTLTKKEYYKSVESTIDKYLSNFEKRVLNYYIQGNSYTNIAQKLNSQVKSVDNAIQRIRKKAIKNIFENN